MNYIFLGTKLVNSFGSASQFHADYYYAKYRVATKMYYRLKVTMTYRNTSGGTGYYNDPVVAIFKMNYNSNPNYNVTKALKPANTGTLYNGQSWSAESDWFDFEKLTGTTPIQISVNNSTTWGFDSPDNYFSLPIDPAMSSMIINNNQSFDVDVEENVSNVLPVTITRYDTNYTHKLKITLENSKSEKTVIRALSDFNSTSITFSEDELSTIYSNADKKSFKLIFELVTYSGTTSLGTSTNTIIVTLSDSDLLPTFTTNLVETNPKVIDLLGATADTLIQNVSKLKLTVTPTAHKNAEISEVQFLHNQIQISKKEVPYEYIFDVKNSIFDVTVIDSRGESATTRYTKNIVEYLPVEISSYSFKRVSSTSSNIKLNAIIRYKQTAFNTINNVPTIKWKLDDGEYTSLTAEEYTLDVNNNQISINNLILEDILPYNISGKMYLYVSDLLTEDAENFDVLKGIPTFDYGEHDLQVNGTLYVADENRQNKLDVKDALKRLAGIEYLKAGITNQQNPSADYVVKLDKEIYSNTDKLEISENGIKIGKGVSLIEVSGNTMVGGDKTASHYIWGKIFQYRGSKSINFLVGNIKTLTTSQYWGSTPLVSTRCPVQEGDVIKLICDSQVGGFLRTDSGATFLEVRIIK